MSAGLASVNTAIRTTCQGCEQRVVLARLPNGYVVALDHEEVTPPMPCPLCRSVISRGHTLTGWCWRCGGTTMVGDPLPQPGVAVNPDGKARVYRGRRSVGEAVHRLHACEVTLALVA